MKDKIYVHIGHHLGLMQATSIPTSAPGEEEYIRKDTLLEWAKNQHGHFSKREQEEASAYGASPDAIFFSGKCEAFKSLIDKLQSL